MKRILTNKLEKWIVPQTKQDILVKIKKYLDSPQGFFHIISLNPETIMQSIEQEEVEQTIDTAQIRIIDGVGVYLAARMLGVLPGTRITGVELMSDLLQWASDERLRVVLIGGSLKVAERVAECQKRAGSKAKFVAIEGVIDIANPKKSEEEAIFSIVADAKPHFVFVAFGSPEQELWLDRHKSHFVGAVCVGVGGAFDFISGRVPRAPRIIRHLGLEWLFRLAIQPWRFVRQRKLLSFAWYVFRERFLD